MERADEKFCKDALISYLCLAGHKVNAEHNKNDPPDYFLTIDKKKYQLEITRLIDCKVDDTPRLTINNRRIKLAQDIDQRAKFEGILNGAYCIIFSGEGIHNYKKNKTKQIKTHLLEFIKQTMPLENTEMTQLWNEDGEQISVIKFHRLKSYVISTTGFETAYEAEIINKAAQVLQRSLKEKIANKKLNPQSKPTILGLLNQYPFASSNEFLKASQNVEEEYKRIFEEIFVVDNNRKVTSLISKFLKN